ncbi:MAG: hypothetical protein ISR91_07535 [Candidatus Delongbacteria bacterium]|nr:hypothetical protein [Candidatus Delongbacteria bacterium]
MNYHGSFPGSILISLGWFLLAAAPLQAGSGGAQSIASAGGFMVTARGIEAAGLNPANLGYSLDLDPTPLRYDPTYRLQHWSVSFLGLNASVYNNAVSPRWVNNSLFGGLNLDEGNNRSEFLSVFDDNGWDLQALLQLRLLGVAWKNFALTIAPELQQDMRLPTDLLHAAFDGIYFEEPISLADTESSMQAVIPVTLAYGQPVQLPWLEDRCAATYLGVGFKTLLGVVCGQIDHSEGKLLSKIDSIAVDSRVQISTVGLPLDDESDLALGINGVGFALDLGMAVDINERLQCGLALHNLLGHINWSGTNARSYDFGYELNLNRADIEEISGYNEAELDSLQETWTTADSSFARDGFRTAWPAYMLLGTHYQWLDQIGFSAVYRQSFNPKLSSALRPRLALASELTYLPWLPLRLGFALGGLEGFQYGTGFGLAFTHYQLDFGFSQSGGMFNWAKGVTLGLEQRIYF